MRSAKALSPHLPPALSSKIIQNIRVVAETAPDWRGPLKASAAPSAGKLSSAAQAATAPAPAAVLVAGPTPAEDARDISALFDALTKMAEQDPHRFACLMRKTPS